MTRIHTRTVSRTALPAWMAALAALAVAGTAVAGGSIHEAWQARMATANNHGWLEMPRVPRGSGDLQLFANLADFQAATAGWDLAFEDFSSVNPMSGAPCHEPANHDMGQPGTTILAPICFYLGDLVPGFSVRTNLGYGPSGPGMWTFGAGVGNLPVSVVGAQAPASTTMVDFHPAVMAVAMNAFDWQAGTPLTIEVLGEGGRHLGDFTLSAPVPYEGVFAGFISPEPVHRVEVRSQSGATQMISNLRFGGRPGGYTVDPTQVHFGAVPVAGHAQASVTLMQTGDMPVQLPVLPAPAAPFVLVGDDCSDEVLAPGESCELAYSYEPVLAQSHRQELHLAPHGAADGPALLLTGRGVSPHLHLDHPVLAFGELPAGQQATASTVLANPEAVPLQVAGISHAGAPFSLLDGPGACPPAPFELEPGGSCSLTYQVTSAGPQAQRARVLIESNDRSSPRRLLLTLGIEDRIFSNGFEVVP